MGSFGRVLVVIGFIRVRWVRSGTPLGLFRFYGFIRDRPGGRRVNLGSLCSFGRALEVNWFIRFRWIHSGAPWESMAH